LYLRIIYLCILWIIRHFNRHWCTVQIWRYSILDWSVYTCLTHLYDGRDMYIIYYIKNNYMFRQFSLAIFRLINEKLSKQLYSNCEVCIKLSKQLYSTCVGCIQPTQVEYSFLLSFSFINLKVANQKCRNM